MRQNAPTVPSPLDAAVACAGGSETGLRPGGLSQSAEVNGLVARRQTGVMAVRVEQDEFMLGGTGGDADSRDHPCSLRRPTRREGAQRIHRLLDPAGTRPVFLRLLASWLC